MLETTPAASRCSLFHVVLRWQLSGPSGGPAPSESLADSFLVDFASALNAARCAVAYLSRVLSIPPFNGTTRSRRRIAIATNPAGPRSSHPTCCRRDRPSA